MERILKLTIILFFYSLSLNTRAENLKRDIQLLCKRSSEGQEIEFVIRKSAIDEQHQKLVWQLSILNSQAANVFEHRFKREKIIDSSPSISNNFFFPDISEGSGEVFIFKSLGEIMGDEAFTGAVLEVSFNSADPMIKKVIFKAAIAQTPHQMIEGELVGTLWIQTKDFAEKVGEVELSCRSTFPSNEVSQSNR